MAYLPWDPKPVYLGGKQVPGRVEIRGLKNIYNWKLPEVRGVTGTPATFEGTKLRNFQLAISLTTRAQYQAWMDISHSVLVAPTKLKPFYLKIDHPLLADYKIQWCVLREEPQPEQDDKFQRYSVVLELTEYAPPVVTAVKAVAAAGGDAQKVRQQGYFATEIENQREMNQRLSNALDGVHKDVDFLGRP